VAGLPIALMLVVVAVVCVPLRLWASRLRGSWRRPAARVRRERTAMVLPRHLSPGLRRMLRLGREAVEVIDTLGPITAEYRRTLPFVSLFFAESQGAPHVCRDRWIVEAREAFAGAIGDVAGLLWRWAELAERLPRREHLALQATGGLPPTLMGLVAGAALPRTWGQARRFRFCEDQEVDHLVAALAVVAGELRNLEATLARRATSPYR
jgi:hypothetical protein